MERRFSEHMVVRLPGLFGSGLKKNVIFDMVTGNMCDKISPNGVFQWSLLHRFGNDLRAARDAGVSVLNVAVVPISTACC